MTIKCLEELEPVRQYLHRIGAESRTLKSAVVKEMHGRYWRDICVIKFTPQGTVIAPDEFLPSESEEEKIREAFKNVTFPKLLKLKEMVTVPPEVEQADPKNVFIFRNEKKEIIMIQVRCENNRGERFFLPLTYWSDSIWRRCEPGDTLPLYNLDRIENQTTAFVHEGAKAARYCQWLVDQQTDEAKEALNNHPWGEELQDAVHVAWVGGALSPHRTDWSALKRAGIRSIFVVSDNDYASVSAVPSIAFQLRVPTFHVQFTNEWPASFDLADPFPDSMFRDLEGVPRYRGPTFRQCLHPATWMTDKLKTEKGPPQYTLRPHAKQMWAYVEDADLFVCRRLPEILRSEKILNNMLSPFSHVKDTAKLVVNAYAGRSAALCYRPDQKGMVVTQGSSSAINLHVPSQVRREEGDPSPWLEFLDYMFPNDEERKQVARWCATLIARPDLRMEYGLLLVSEAQGVGKTTLGSAVLAPLIGSYNVGYPSEKDVVESAFNDWLANKRLVIVNEIYSGHSWKAYHALKSLITDRDITVNVKYQKPYTIENWCHFFACSNSLRALRIEEDDRRWFYPEVTEKSWPKAKFESLRGWLDSGGLGVVKGWAEDLGDYVFPGERAPMTVRKRELIEGSRSEAQHEAAALAEELASMDRPAGYSMKSVVLAVRERVQGRVHDTDYQLRKTMLACGLKVAPARIRVDGRLQYVLVNRALWDMVNRNGRDWNSVVNHLIKLEERI